MFSPPCSTSHQQPLGAAWIFFSFPPKVNEPETWFVIHCPVSSEPLLFQPLPSWLWCSLLSRRFHKGYSYLCNYFGCQFSNTKLTGACSPACPLPLFFSPVCLRLENHFRPVSLSIYPIMACHVTAVLTGTAIHLDGSELFDCFGIHSNLTMPASFLVDGSPAFICFISILKINRLNSFSMAMDFTAVETWNELLIQLSNILSRVCWLVQPSSRVVRKDEPNNTLWIEWSKKWNHRLSKHSWVKRRRQQTRRFDRQRGLGKHSRHTEDTKAQFSINVIDGSDEGERIRRGT